MAHCLSVEREVRPTSRTILRIREEQRDFQTGRQVESLLADLPLVNDERRLSSREESVTRRQGPSGNDSRMGKHSRKRD